MRTSLLVNLHSKHWPAWPAMSPAISRPPQLILPQVLPVACGKGIHHSARGIRPPDSHRAHFGRNSEETLQQEKLQNGTPHRSALLLCYSTVFASCSSPFSPLQPLLDAAHCLSNPSRLPAELLETMRAAPTPGSGCSAGMDVCSICLERLSSETVSLGCGHLLHLNCLTGLSLCPMCRVPIDYDRVKLAEAVPAAAAPAGGFLGYAVRSAAAAIFGRRLPAVAVLGRGAGAAAPAPAATRMDASDADAATDIPAADRDELLGGIMAQLGAAVDMAEQAPAADAYLPDGLGLPAPPAATATPGESAGQAAAPSTWAFCIDVSSETPLGGAGSKHSLLQCACSWRLGKCCSCCGSNGSPGTQTYLHNPTSYSCIALKPSRPHPPHCRLHGQFPRLAARRLLPPLLRAGQPGLRGGLPRVRGGLGHGGGLRCGSGHPQALVPQARCGGGGGGTVVAMHSCCIHAEQPAPSAPHRSDQSPHLVQLNQTNLCICRAPAAATFDKAAFLAEVTGAVRGCGLERYGTYLCTATCQVIAELADRAALLTGSSSEAVDTVDGLPPAAPEGGPAAAEAAAGLAGGGRGGAAAAGPLAGQQHSFVLLTDGDAVDEDEAFVPAQALMSAPPFPGGGFRALLVSDGGTARLPLTALVVLAAAAACLDGLVC